MWNFTQADFNRAIATVAPGMATTTMLPILTTLKVELGRETGRVTAANLSATITADLPVRGTADTGICLPGDLLARIVKDWPADELIYVEVNPESLQATIHAGRHTAYLNGRPVEDYPNPAHEDGSLIATLPADALARVVRFAKVAVISTQRGANRMQHLCIEIDTESKLWACGSDGVRLHIGYVDLTEAHTPGQWLIPYSELGDLLGVLKTWGEEPVTLTGKADSWIRFMGHGTAFFSRVYAEGFFPWRTIRDNRATVAQKAITVPARELQKAIKTLLIMAEASHTSRIENPAIWLDVNESTLIPALLLYSKASEIGGAQTFFPIKAGIPGRAPIQVSGKLLLDAVAQVESNDAVLLIPLAEEQHERNALIVTAPGDACQAYLMPLVDLPHRAVDSGGQTTVE